MRISEILFWNTEPVEANRADPHLDLPHDPSGDLFTKLANAYAKDRLMKRFWNAKGLESQRPGPAPPDAGTEPIPSGTTEPTTASWQAEPVRTEPQVGQQRLVPLRQYRGISGG
jgi:hypothetical protein